MSSNRNYLNPTAGVFQNQNKTLTITPNPKEAEENNFAALNSQRQTKVKINIRDFTNGKGDSASVCSANIDYKKALALYEAIKASVYFPDITYQIREDKVVSDALPSNSAHPGKGKVTKLTIKFQKDKGRKWYVSVENGYAYFNVVNGSRRFDPKSYEKESGGYAYVEIEDMLMYFHDSLRLMDFHAYSVYQTKYPDWKNRYDTLMQNTGYYNNSNNIPTNSTTTAFRNTAAETPAATPAPAPQPVNTQTQASAPAPSAKAQKPYTVQIASDPYYEGKEICCEAICNGKTFHIYFREGEAFPRKLLESKQKGYAVVLTLSTEGRKAYFNSIV